MFAFRSSLDRSRFFSTVRRFWILLGFLAVIFPAMISTAAAQTGPERGPAPGSREAMWPAPTAEDWNKPCLITWQRNWEDALAVSRETGKAILVCVNMDGEIASEHYAGIRYRDPEIAKLYEPYVCVIASVYRHNPRDYDEEGRRILCPRFGSVTCGEHIAIEPGLFKEFFDDRRIAPRHIGVELDGSETYDVYYAFDTDSVFQAIREGVEGRDVVPATVARGDRTIVERVASRDIQDRIAVEAAYNTGDRDLRRSLLEAAVEHPDAEQIDLLRLAVFGFDMELSKLARKALAQSDSQSAYNLIGEALRVPMEASERDSLISALSRIGESTPKARMLAVVHQGLAGNSGLVNVASWTEALTASPKIDPAVEHAANESWIEKQNEVFASNDPAQYEALADAFLNLATVQPESEQKFARSLFRDALSTGQAAENLGAGSWRVHAAIGLASFYLDDLDEAYKRAEAAVRILPPGTNTWSSMAVLDLFAKARRKSIAQAVREKKDWTSWSKAFEGTGEWLTDVHATYSVLERHPFGTDEHVAAHYDFLKVLGAAGQAARILDEGLDRFPASWSLHDRLRGRILREKGVEGLETVYEAMLREKSTPSEIVWFAGYASLVAAEFHRRLGSEEKALGAYSRAIELYERGIEIDPNSRDTADHFIAMAFAGRARLAFERGDYDDSLNLLLASFARKPDAAATLDGLNISPVDTARMLMQRLKDLNQGEPAARLDAALNSLDPELLQLPAYEREGPSGPTGNRRPPWRGRRTPGQNR